MSLFKKMLSILCVLSLCVSVMAPLALAEGSTMTMYVENDGKSVNMRDKPNTTDSTILDQIPSGTAVEAGTLENGWYPITVNGESGYMYSTYLTKVNPNPPTWYVTGTTQGLNLRSEAGSSNVIAAFENGTAVTVYYVENGWAFVSVDGQEGFVNASYLTAEAPEEEEEEEPSDPAPATDPYQVTAESLALYASPTAGATVIGTYPAGTKVGVVFTVSTGWARVDINGTLGYMLLTGLEKVEEEESTTPDDTTDPSTPSGGTKKYITSGNGGPVALRKEAKKSSKNLIDYYPVDTEVIVYSDNGSWSYVSIDGQFGYMMSKYLVVKNSESEEDSEGSATPEEPELPSGGVTKYITSDNGGPVALREEAKRSSKNLIDYYPVDTEVIVYSSNGTWSYVSIDGQLGYMMSKYLTDKTADGEEDSEDTTTPEEPELPSGGVTKYITSDNGGPVALREEAKKSSKNLIDYYPVGTEVIAYSSNGTWSYVSIDGQLGYMMSKYLTDKTTDGEEDGTTEEGDASESRPAVTGVKYVKTGNDGGLALRRTPNKTSSKNIITFYDNGTKVQIYSISGAWAYVRVNGTDGYMMAQYLSNTPPAGAAPEESVDPEEGTTPEEGTGTEGGAGTEGGTGTEGGAGTEGGTGTEGGAGTEGGTGTEGGAGTEGGSGTEGGAGTEGGTDTEGGTGTEGGENA